MLGQAKWNILHVDRDPVLVAEEAEKAADRMTGMLSCGGLSRRTTL